MADLISMLAAAAGAGGEAPPTPGYQISRSLRFNSADSAYLSRTPASTTDRTKWSLSLWVKRSALGAVQTLLGARINGDNYFRFGFNASDQLNVDGYYASSQRVLLTTTPVYRDVSAFYHILIVGNTPDATSSNRFKIYVNGVQVTAFGTATYPSQNAIISPVNETSVAHEIGRYPLAVEYFNGYLADINFVDGQALTPSDFGETDETTGVWKPKAYAGTYGTNGFHLDFSDNTSTTTIGYDAAGSNNWTANNFSVAAGVNNDSLVDTPTPYGTDTGAGGEVRGNYCTLNALDNNATLSNGNLQVVTSSSTTSTTKSTFAIPQSGKWYFEVEAVSGASIGYVYVGGGAANEAPGVLYRGSDGDKRIDGTFSSYGSAWSNGDIIGVAVNVDDGEINFYRNGVDQGTISYTFVGKTMFPAISDSNVASTFTAIANFGQRPFAYTAPSGFKALCTTNLPTPTIADGSEYFNTVLYTGDGTSSNSITGVGFQPDLVWLKARSAATNHTVYDAVRGVPGYLIPNLTDAEAAGTIAVTSLDSDGFSLSTGAFVNGSGVTFAAWNWNAGGSNATNTDGTITSTVRANPTAGFSIVSYTGNGSSSPYPTVGHGLGVAPQIYIVKRRDNTGNWVFWHTLVDGSLDYMYLNTTAASANSALATVPTSTVMTVGGADANTNTATQIAYCFAEVEGYSKFGSYTGNGSADGPFVYCGFRPTWILIKSSSVAPTDWLIYDVKRNTYNVMNSLLKPNSSGAEATYALIDALSNGFKIRNTGANGSGETVIFAAFAKNPFKYSLAR